MNDRLPSFGTLILFIITLGLACAILGTILGEVHSLKERVDKLERKEATYERR